MKYIRWFRSRTCFPITTRLPKASVSLNTSLAPANSCSRCPRRITHSCGAYHNHLLQSDHHPLPTALIRGLELATALLISSRWPKESQVQTSQMRA